MQLNQCREIELNDAKDKTARQLYRWMAREGSRIGETDLVGRTKMDVDEGHQWLVDSLSEIEEFVEDVIASELPAFKLKEGASGKEIIERLPLSEHVSKVVKIPFFYFPPQYQYSCQVELFIHCWMALRLDKEGFRQLRGASSQLGKEPYELFNDLVSLIRSESKTSAYKRKAYDRENHAKRNCRSASKYITALYKLDTELQSLRFEFFYRSAVATSVTAAQAKQDLERLLNNRRGKSSLFSGCVGYLWILHHGLEKGWHIHLISFYSSKLAHATTARAFEIGRYWNDAITRGQGRFWYRDEIPKDGIGPKSSPASHPEQQRRLLLHDVCNLIQSEQYLRPAKRDGGRNFGKGERKQVARPSSEGTF